MTYSPFRLPLTLLKYATPLTGVAVSVPVMEVPASLVLAIERVTVSVLSVATLPTLSSRVTLMGG